MICCVSSRGGGLILQKSVFAEPIRVSALLYLLIVVSVLVSGSNAQQTLPNAPSAQKAKTHAAPMSDSGWPRTVVNGADTFVIYQPQVDKWEGNRIDLYSAVELKTGKDSPAKYGVIWFNARTEVDKINRLVTLDQPQLTKVKFPVAPDKEPELTALLQKKLPGATKTMSLDRLTAAVEANDEAIKGVEVKNDPPKVIFSTKPSLLVLIDGTPQLSEIQGTNLQRVINTKAVLLFEGKKEDLLLASDGLVVAGASVGGALDLREETARRYEESGRVCRQPNTGTDAGYRSGIQTAFIEGGGQECRDSNGVRCVRAGGAD